MKKIVFIAAAVMLSGCATESETTELVTSSVQEQYQTEPAFVFEKDPLKETTTVVEEYAVVKEKVTDKVIEQKPSETVVEEYAAESVVISPPSDEKPVIYKYATKAVDGYTIQVVASKHESGFSRYVNRLPAAQPVWVNERDLNGAPWYTLLYGQFETKEAARQALQALPQEMKDFGPFIRDLRQIKTSPSPKLTQVK